MDRLRRQRRGLRWSRMLRKTLLFAAAAGVLAALTLSERLNQWKTVDMPLHSAGLSPQELKEVDKLVEAWRAEHPTVAFTRLVVGDCAGGEGDSMTGFADNWDMELLMQFHAEWSARKYLSDSLLDVDHLVTVVDSILRNGASLSLHSVTAAPRLTSASPATPTLD